MNRRSLFVFSVLFCVVCGIAPIARAANADDIPEATKRSADASSQQSAIASAIANAIGTLSKDDISASDQGAARDWFANQAIVMGSTTAVSSSYQNIYTTEVNTALLKIAKPDSSVRIRVNAAIIAAKVSTNSKSINLLPVVKVLMHDPSDGVMFNAIHAAGSILNSGIANGKLSAADRDALMDDIVKTVPRSTGVLSGAIAHEGYNALKLNFAGTPNAKTVIGSAVDHLLQIQAERLKSYKGAEFPDNPPGDAEPLLYINDATVWAAISPKQQVWAIQLGCNLMSLAANTANKLPSNSNGDIIRAIAEEATSIKGIVSNILHDNTIEKQLDKASKLRTGTQPGELINTVNDAIRAIQSLTPFSTVQTPGATT